MPNWCFTQLTFFAESDHESEIRELHNAIKTALSEPPVIQNDFGSGWLGNLLERHGISWQDVRCRGYVTSLGEIENRKDLDEYSFELTTEDAWYVQNSVWNTVLPEKYPHVGYVYLAEEGNWGIYDNTDTRHVYYPQQYEILYLPDDGDNFDEFYGSEAEMLKDASVLWGQSFSTEDELYAFIRTLPEEDYVQINKYREVT